MPEPTIKCPHCKATIKLTESLAAPLLEETKREFEEKLKAKDEQFSRREKALARREEELEKERDEISAQVKAKTQERLKVEMARIAKEEAKKAELAVQAELKAGAQEKAALEEALKKNNEKLEQAQKAQAELLREKRELEDAKRELALTVEKRVAAEIGGARDKARQEAEDSLRLRVAEKEQTISAMSKQIEELRRKAEQGSQQLQGEVQELELESVLRMKFPRDIVEPVPKGEHGGDVLQTIKNNLNQSCGRLLWESKRTKSWSDTWLPKLRDDQRTAKADLSVLVTQVLPKGIDTFGFLEGVWVTTPAFVVPLAVALRQGLTEVALAKVSREGQHSKQEMIYDYLVGPRFRQRIQAIVESFSTMREDLEKEKKAMIKQWAKREEQIGRLMESTLGMYGDLQGIAGKSMQEIEGVGFKALAVSEDK